MNILGISGSTHDSSVALVSDGEVVMAIEEERISRRKHAPGQKPLESTIQLLEQQNLRPENIDLVSYFIDPAIFNAQVFRHVLIDDYPRYLFHPITYNTPRFLKRGERYANDIKALMNHLGIKAPIRFVPHHLAHAAGAFYLSGFPEAMILVLDNMGELDSTSLLVGRGQNLTLLKNQNIPHSLGMFYAVMTDYLGFKPWDEEGKVMALASHGTSSLALDDVVDLDASSFYLKKPFQMVQTPQRERCYSNELIRLLGPPRTKTQPLEQRHRDIAALAQLVIEETAKHLVSYLHKQTGITNLCVTGGVGLNCKMNGELANLSFVKNIYVPSAPGDNGTSLGAAVYTAVNDEMMRFGPLYTASLGRGFDNKNIKIALESFGVSYQEIDNIPVVATGALLKEKVIAWYQGKSEFGPRSLGNRSIIALPNSTDVRDRINREIKLRELWRPLCPSVSSDAADLYFYNSTQGRFMNVAYSSTALGKERASGVVHIDGTARSQAVYKEEFELYHALLSRIGESTGDPVLLNTSFNCKGEPIVDSPLDALKSFQHMQINTMIIGNFIVRKK